MEYILLGCSVYKKFYFNVMHLISTLSSTNDLKTAYAQNAYTTYTTKIFLSFSIITKEQTDLDARYF